MVHVFVNCSGVSNSAEFRLGMRLLAELLPEAHWIVGNSPSFEEFWDSQQPAARQLFGVVVLLHTPFVFPTRDCLERLAAALADSGAPVVLPVDPRGWGSDLPLDYSTLHGFERFTAKLAAQGRQLLAYDGRPPLLQLMRAERLHQTGPAEWAALLSPPPGALLVTDGFVHPYFDYYGGDRAEVLALIPPQTKRLLDVGGGEGRFAGLVKARLGCEVQVAELNPDVAALAQRQVDRVWVGDFLSLPITERYDCITLLDVVEHVPDPVAMLSRAAELLTPGGTLVASIPNLGHWSVVVDLLEGRWDYIPAGIACWTHLRFFTRPTMEQVFRFSGLAVERVVPILIPAPATVRESLSSSAAAFLPSWESLDAYAYQLVARRVV